MMPASAASSAASAPDGWNSATSASAAVAMGASRSIHGHLRVVTSFQALPHPMLKKDAMGANAHTVIQRSAFNAGKYAPNVSDEVRIDIAVEAIRE